MFNSSIESQPSPMVHSSFGKRPDKDDYTLYAVLILLVIFISNACRGSTVDEIRKEALRQGVDPEIAISVAKVESGLNPKAVGSKGEIGIFQIMPYHGSKTLIAKNNIRMGVTLLRRAKEACMDMGPYWPICYNQGPNKRPKHPSLHPYYKKVMATI